MSKIVVTGGAGFIGSHIVDRLIADGHEVHVVDNMYFGKKENVNPKAILHVVDIRDYEKLLPVFSGAEYVFHEAALLQVQYSIENPLEANEVNVQGLLNVLKASEKNKIKRLIFASSCAIYGDPETLPLVEDMNPNPLSPYAAQKYIGEVYCGLWSRIYGLETVCLRYCNVYGDRQAANGSYPLVMAKFFELKKQGKPLTITGDGKNTRDYVHVRDVVEANLKAMISNKVGKGEAINIGTGNEYSVNEIAKLVGGEVVYIEPRIEPRAISVDIKKAVELLGWHPSIKFEDGLAELKKIHNLS